MGDARIFGNPPWLVAACGAKASGKTVLVKYATYIYARDFSYITVISPSMINGWYQEFIDPKYIHGEYSDDLIQKIIDKQESFAKAGKTVHTLLILEDILASPEVRFEKRKASVLNKVFSANRHWNISVIIVAQKLKGLPRLCRDNCDHICFTRCMRSAYDDIYEGFGHLPKAEFYKFIEDGTREHRILMFTAQAKKGNEHFKCFSVPPEFLDKRFRLVF